ncbi:MAG TPA: ATP-dependent DNA helicase RecG [Candidatus Aminicenantes bacterium]|nr:ATP-dependent DNA helicase RecG [Candidatus Aminicenantes bacterium]
MKTPSSLLLSDPVERLPGVGPKRALLLREEGIESVEDLLFTFPFGFEDRSDMRDPSRITPSFTGWMKGQVLRAAFRWIPKRRMPLVQAWVGDPEAPLSLLFFNQKYLLASLKPGLWLAFYGTVQEKPRGGLEVVPRRFRISPQEPREGVFPLYRKIKALGGGTLTNLISKALEACPIDEVLPEGMRQELKLPSRASSLKLLHKGEGEGLKEARESLVFEEFFLFHFRMMLFKSLTQEEKKERAYLPPEEAPEPFESALKMSLTCDQRRAFQEIGKDMASPVAMQRLLQGDVGSGKTLVALLAAFHALRSGSQVVFLAPTEVLARQHFSRVQRMELFKPFRPTLLCGSLPAPEKRKTLEGLASGELRFALGTHALFQEGVQYKELGLVIIDEQHRFGVAQRTSLTWKGRNPDLLVMTATPIPRSLFLTLYSGLKVSVLREKPFPGGEIKTRVVPLSKRADSWRWMAERCASGGQGFLVFPLIEESEKSELEALEEGFEAFGRLYPGVKAAMLHGKMKAAEKERIRERFEKNEISLLFTTSVIEVGIDVPSASFIMVEHPERYGLAQLHQIRGRVGRRGEESFCFLLGGGGGEKSKERRKILLATQDGFKIAEEDLRLRGMGEPTGVRQWGEGAFRLGDPVEDWDLLKRAYGEAGKALTEGRFSAKMERMREELLENRVRVGIS